MRTYTRPVRVSNEMISDLKSALRTRIENKLTDPFDRNEISIREISRLATRTNAWKNVMEELRVKPKKTA